MTISGGRTKQLEIFCRVTGFTSDFLSFIVVEHIRFFHGALHLFWFQNVDVTFAVTNGQSVTWREDEPSCGVEWSVQFIITRLSSSSDASTSTCHLNVLLHLFASINPDNVRVHVLCSTQRQFWANRSAAKEIGGFFGISLKFI